MMIVIAVAGSLVTYAWVMGYLSFTTQKAGRAIQIQSIANHENGVDLVVYVQNVGEGTVSLDGTGAALIYVNGGLRPCTIDPADGLLAEGSTATIVVAGAAGGPGEKVVVRVVALDGTFMEAETYPGESTGGGGGGLIIPTVIQVSSTDTGFSGVEAGDLLVVIANTRTGDWPTLAENALIATAPGYTPHMCSYYFDSGARRAVVILTKISTDGSESGPVTVTWDNGADPDPDQPYTYATIYQVFRGATDYNFVGFGTNQNGDVETDNLVVPSAALADPGTENILTIGATVIRDPPGTVEFTNLDSPVSADSGNCFSTSEYSYGAAVTETSVTWDTVQRASGFLIQFACS
jgi:hypothetical protein